MEEDKKEVKEIQETIIPIEQREERVSEQEFLEVLKTISPGTHLRVGIDGALKAGKGALIVVESDKLIPLIDGGFKVNCRFTPQKLVELTKMDGAIVLSKDMKKINLANVLLAPDNKIRTSETGTRHKAAERTAKQTGSLVVAISERKHEISLFYKNMKYPIKSTEDILRKTIVQIQLLEKHREIFEKYVEKLNRNEIKNHQHLSHPIQLIQKGKMILKITSDLKRDMTELGNEGVILKSRLKEIIAGVEKETDLAIKDYTKLDVKKTKLLLDTLTYDELLEAENIMRALAHDTISYANPRGWRVLTKTSLEEPEIAAVLKELGTLGKIMHSNANVYHPILGEDKAKVFKNEIERLKLSID